MKINLLIVPAVALAWLPLQANATPPGGPMTYSDAATQSLTEAYEGLDLSSYPDPATGGAPWTIGYGHTGADVHPGMTISQPQAESLLRQDLTSAENAVNNAVTVPLTQGEFDALVDFTYNVGAGNLRSSNLLRLVNAGDMAGADAQFANWDKADGKVLAGLVNRRAAEASWFNDGTVPSTSSMLAAAAPVALPTGLVAHQPTDDPQGTMPTVTAPAGEGVDPSALTAAQLAEINALLNQLANAIAAAGNQTGRTSPTTPTTPAASSGHGVGEHGGPGQGAGWARNSHSRGGG